MDIIQTREQQKEFLRQSLNTKAVLNFDECCLYTGLKPSSLYKLTSKKIIPHSKPNGKMIFFCREKLDEWLLSGSVKSERELDNAAHEYARKNKRTF